MSLPVDRQLLGRTGEGDDCRLHRAVHLLHTLARGAFCQALMEQVIQQLGPQAELPFLLRL
ncbi:hypothetical protein D9M69_690360 [compost metagenome]